MGKSCWNLYWSESFIVTNYRGLTREYCDPMYKFAQTHSKCESEQNHNGIDRGYLLLTVGEISPNRLVNPLTILLQ